MDKVAQIGGKRIAAPPGSPKVTVSLDNAAKYYREALEMGEKAGVQPLLELWGTHPLLGPLSRGIYVTVAAGRPDASLLLDVFHLYKSGTAFTALKQINGASLHLMHLNDYPQAADSSTLNDGSRIYPGDGVAPLRQILRDLRDNGFRGYLSLELFNKGTGPGAPTRISRRRWKKSAPRYGRRWRKGLGTVLRSRGGCAGLHGLRRPSSGVFRPRNG